MPSVDRELQPFFDSWLPFFDQQYSSLRIPVSQRPFHATIAFIRSAIGHFENTTMEAQLSPPWFGHWYENVYTWYKEKYGDAINNNIDDDIHSFIIIDKLVYALKIPSKVTEKHGITNEFYWVIFPNNVQRSENPLNWIQNKPNPDMYNVEKIRKEIVRRANLLRRIRIYLLSTSINDEAHNNLFYSIPTHLRNFALDITSLSNIGASNSIWEINLAVEKAIKVYLNSKKIKYKKTHDVRMLYYDFCRTNCNTRRINIKYLPSGDDAVKYRYGELVIKDLSRLNHMYIEALRVIASVLSCIDRKLIMKNTKMLIKNPYFINS